MLHGLEQILGRADAHQISRSVDRHLRSDGRDDVVHDALLLAHAQAPDRVAVETHLYSSIKTLATKIQMPRSLNNAKECLTTAQAVSPESQVQSPMSKAWLGRGTWDLGLQF